MSVGDGLFGDRFFLRGLEVGTRDFRKNGFLDPTFTPRDFANIERVEILKGPASLLFGPGLPAGTVNFVTKKPLMDDFAYGDFQFGGFDLQRYTVDTNAILDNQGRWLARVNAAYETTNSFREFGFTERYIAAPAVTWLMGPDTSLTWEAEIIGNKRRGDQGVPALGGDPEFFAPETYFGDPNADFLNTQDYRTSLVFQHILSDNWAMQVGASTVFYEFPGVQTFPLQQIGPTQFFRGRQTFSNRESSSSLIASVTGEFETGPLTHRVLAGTEFVYYNAQSQFGLNQFAPIDGLNPQYPPLPVGPEIFSADFPVTRQARRGFFVQDFVELSEHWQVFGGVRFDSVDFKSQRTIGPLLVEDEETFDRTSPRAGVIYSPLPGELMSYFTYSQSFTPPGGIAGFTLESLRPELGESYEVGIKALLLENLSLHAAAFHITRDNTPFTDVTPMGPLFFQVGQERAQGFELELIGALTDRWSVFSGYSYTDTELTDSLNPVIQGQRQRNVPLHTANLWTRYNVVQTTNQTLGLGLGLFYVGSRSANLADTVLLPAYTRCDAGVFYRYGRWNADLYVENVFDNNYAVGSVNELQIFPGAPVNARGMVGVRF